MKRLFDDALHVMERAFADLEAKVPKPVKMPVAGGYWYRYAEKTVEQAIVQKLARYVSGLYAARVLLRHGFVQEQAALQRMLDEFGEDITFLALGLTSGDWTPRHQAYLDFFWQEEFVNPEAPLDQNRRRPSVPRKKIHAYLRKHVSGGGVEGPAASTMLKTMSGAYSGYVHGASPQIMDLYGGEPPRYHLAGMLGTSRIASAESDLWNYLFRGLLTFMFSALALGCEDLLSTLEGHLRTFEQNSGTSYLSSV